VVAWGGKQQQHLHNLDVNHEETVVLDFQFPNVRLFCDLSSRDRRVIIVLGVAAAAAVVKQGMMSPVHNTHT
jgi:hypothetical protein